MKNRYQYILFVVVVLLVQVLLLNNLTFSPYVAPLAYVVLIIMTPLGTSSLKMIFVGLTVGALMDITMGTIGINVLATLPLAYFRRPILHFFGSYTDMDGEGGVPTQLRLTGFHNYVVAMVVLHNLLFFGFEHPTTANFGFIALRFVVSTLISLGVVYFFIGIFTSKLAKR
jgi:hypothetical protein